LGFRTAGKRDVIQPVNQGSVKESVTVGGRRGAACGKNANGPADRDSENFISAGGQQGVSRSLEHKKEVRGEEEKKDRKVSRGLGVR